MSDSFEQDLLALLPNLRRFAFSLSRRSDTADDLVQSTVERAVKARDRRPHDMPLKPWLFRILRNLWIDGLRREQTRGAEVDSCDAPEAGATDGVRVVEARLMLRDTEAVLRTLPQQQREVIVLVCYEGLSYGETAEFLGVPTGTVMSRLARGRLALARLLGLDGHGAALGGQTGGAT